MENGIENTCALSKVRNGLATEFGVIRLPNKRIGNLNSELSGHKLVGATLNGKLDTGAGGGTR